MNYFNPSAAWACAPLLLPKPGTEGFGFTVDLRPINNFTVKQEYPMPNLKLEMAKTAGSKFSALVALSHGYWLLLLKKSSQECQSLITTDVIYKFTRVLHGKQTFSCFHKLFYPRFNLKTFEPTLCSAWMIS